MEPTEELLQQFCLDLRRLWKQAGGPTLRALSGQVRLGKSQVGAILGGAVRRPPDWAVVKALVGSCHRYARERGRAGRVSVSTSVDEFWRPRHTMLEHAFQHLFRPVTAVAQAPDAGVPRQLPAAAPHFTGRVAELTKLTDLIDHSGGADDAVVISAITGSAGVGKTSLAVRWAQRVADRFPDGQLFVDLRGFDQTGSAMSPAEAVRGFLDALRVPTQHIPASLDAQLSLYRSRLSGRRMLIVLDNARDARQVRPLLPGSPGCLVLVTSRNQLAGLVAAEGAHPLRLDLLPAAQSWHLLERRLGTRRVAAEPAAVDEIIARCVGLPLALAVVAARAATHPAFRLAALASELRDGLDGFANGDDTTDPRAVFSWSYQALTPAAARLFRLLAVHPGPDFTASAAASTAGLQPRQVRPLLAELTQAHLVAEPAPGRYRFHDLLRAYATELTNTVDGEAHRRAATHRVLDHYLHTAHTADALLDPYHQPITLDPPHRGVTPEHLTDHEQALAWLTAEHAVLLACLVRAADAGADSKTWQLSCALESYLDRRGCWHDEATAQAIAQAVALVAAQPISDRRMQARSHRRIGVVLTRLGRVDDGHHHHEQARRAFHEIGDRIGEAHTHHNLGLLLSGNSPQALAHQLQALHLYRMCGHRQGEALCLNAIGREHALLGKYRQTLSHCQRALAILAELGDHQTEGITWDSIGYAHHHLGDHRQAADCYERALTLHRMHGDRYHEAETLAHLGNTLRVIGSDHEANLARQQASAIFDELGHTL